MKKKINKYELARKLIHIIFGLFLLLLYRLDIFTLPVFYFLFFVGLAFSFFIKSKSRLNLFVKILTNLDKKNYLPAHGMVFFYIGFVSLITFSAIFNLSFAYILIPILIVSFADPASFFFGRLFGETKLPFNHSKTVAGTLAGILTAIGISAFIMPLHFAVITAISAMSMDMINIRVGRIEIDDNLLIPLAAFGAMLLFSSTLYL